MNQDAAARVRSVLDRLLREGTAVSAAYGTHHNLFPVAVSRREGEALRAWVTQEAASRTIEIGLGYGIAALHICEALCEVGDPRARHVAIDPHQSTRFSDCGVQFLEEAGLAEFVDLHFEESQIVLPRLVVEGSQFDLALVDGNHRFDAVFVDLFYLARLVRPGGIVFVDDYQLPGVARAASFFLTNRGWTLEEASTEDDLHHWAALRTSPEVDERPFDYFVDF